MSSTRTWVVVAATLLTFMLPSAAFAQTTGLTLDRLKNATYPSEYSPSGQVTLLDGRFEWNSPPVRGTAAFADGKIGPDFAVVIIGTNTGGSGSFSSLHLVTSSAGTPTAGPGVFIGDRTRAESFVIEGDHVKLSLLTQGPTDPQCCPTQRETRDYIREGGTFRLVTTTITQPGTGAITPPKTGNAGLTGREAAGLTLTITVLLAVFVVGAARRQTRSTRG